MILTAESFKEMAPGIAKVAIDLFPAHLVPVFNSVGVGPGERFMVNNLIRKNVKGELRSAIGADKDPFIEYVPPQIDDGKKKKKRKSHVFF